VAARRGQSLPDVNTKSEAIYAAHGSFFIFSRRYFEGGGFLDGNLFLYGEEISVAEICRSLGLPVVYEPSLCVLHKEHQSTGKALNRFTYECQKRAMHYVTSRYLSRSPRAVGSCQPDLQ
jgi:GT2 family glycosyltransferase